jgi:hypothetical protein
LEPDTIKLHPNNLAQKPKTFCTVIDRNLNFNILSEKQIVIGLDISALTTQIGQYALVFFIFRIKKYRLVA